MPKREVLYERILKHPLDDAQRGAVAREAAEHCRQLPFPVQSGWQNDGAEFTVKSALATFYATFSVTKLVVSAELSLAARLFATAHNRRQAVEILTAVSDRLDL